MKNTIEVQSENQQDGFRHSNKKHLSIWQLFRQHPTVSSILIGLLAVTAVYFWKDIENSKQKTKIISDATLQIEINQKNMLKLLAKPMVWSIRSEMLRGNMEQVNILITDMVKENNFRYIHLIAPDGTVMLSTDKSLEGKAIGNKVNASLLVLDLPAFGTYIDDVLIVAAPVMGVDKCLATLIVGYSTAEIKLQ